jgi:Protein of Unknown function (DUF2784)
MILYRWLADLVVVIHVAYVAFVVVGMLLILVGLVRHWTWVRNFWFRMIHFVLIASVAAESLLGIVCPLTTWENQLRMAGGAADQPGSFVARTLHALIFFDAPEWVFTVAYGLFALAVLATLIFAPPQPPTRRT